MQLKFSKHMIIPTLGFIAAVVFESISMGTIFSILHPAWYMVVLGVGIVLLGSWHFQRFLVLNKKDDLFFRSLHFGAWLAIALLTVASVVFFGNMITQPKQRDPVAIEMEKAQNQIVLENVKSKLSTIKQLQEERTALVAANSNLMIKKNSTDVDWLKSQAQMTTDIESNKKRISDIDIQLQSLQIEDQSTNKKVVVSDYYDPRAMYALTLGDSLASIGIWVTFLVLGIILQLTMTLSLVAIVKDTEEETIEKRLKEAIQLPNDYSVEEPTVTSITNELEKNIQNDIKPKRKYTKKAKDAINEQYIAIPEESIQKERLSEEVSIKVESNTEIDTIIKREESTSNTSAESNIKESNSADNIPKETAAKTSNKTAEKKKQTATKNYTFGAADETIKNTFLSFVSALFDNGDSPFLKDISLVQSKLIIDDKLSEYFITKLKTLVGSTGFPLIEERSIDAGMLKLFPNYTETYIQAFLNKEIK